MERSTTTLRKYIMLGTQSLFSATTSRNSYVYRSIGRGLTPISYKQWLTFATDDVSLHRDTGMQRRQMSKFRHLQQQQHRDTIETHKKFFPDSFVYRRGDHPYGTREYLLVRPKPNDDSSYNDERQVRSSIDESLPKEMIVLATLHANNNIIFGANVNTKVVQAEKFEANLVPSILDLCPILLHAALTDCSNEGEQPQALSTLHGLSAWVRQCLDERCPIQSSVIQALQERIKNPTESMDHFLKSTSAFERQITNVDAHQQLQCITAIAMNVPRPGHSVVGQKTHADGAFAWEALSREFAVLDDNDDTNSAIKLSDECLLYRQYTESCDLVEVELLANTSPAYLVSAGGAMARFIIM